MTEVSFLSPSKIKTKSGEFTLLGLYDTEEFNSKQTTLKPKLDEFAKKIFCLKADPAVEDKTTVYAFSPENTLINSELLRNGLAGAKKDVSFIYKEYFASLSEEAKTNKLGIYAAAPVQPRDDSKIVERDVVKTYPEITPDQAKVRVGQMVTIKMPVGSVGEGATAVYFNSEKDYTSPSNVAGIILLPAKNSILDNLVHTSKNYEGRTIKLTGKVTMTDGKPQILIEDHTQLELAQ